MADLGSAALHGAAWGVPAAAALAIILLVAAMVEPETMLRGYPPDIRAAYGAPRRRARRIGLVAGVLAASAVLLSVAGVAATLDDRAFWPVMLALACQLAVVQLVDLVILDWLVFVTLQPSFVVLAGTEGMAGYRDIGFHVRAFGKGLTGSLAASALMALGISLVSGTPG